MKRPIISLLTDFGSSDHYVGAMKGVILGICPDAQLVDISHEITPYAITEGAFTLSQAWTCFPAGTIHLVVVDPGVGSSRRPILVEAAGHYFVGPDNGGFTMVYEAVPEYNVREITASRYFGQPVSRTFHGRDIFSPVAAHVGSGVAASEFGDPIKDFQQLTLAEPIQTAPNTWQGRILKIDRFGNVITNFSSKTWLRLATGPFELRIGTTRVTRMAATYVEAPLQNLFFIIGSSGFLEISLNQGSAAKSTAARAGDAIELRLQ